MKRLIWLLPISLVLLVTSCLKDEMNETIVLMGTESYVKRIDSIIPDTLFSYIGDSAVMGDNVIVPNRGNMPPNIQGEFVFGPRELFSYNETYHGNLDTLYIRFGGDPDTINNSYYPQGQHNMMVVCDIKEPGLPLMSVDAFVMGTDNQFTVYFDVTYDNVENPATGGSYSLKRGYVLTGNITNAGIERARLACVNIESSLTDLVNKIFVYRVETDDPAKPFGTAIRKKWYPKY